MSMTIILLTNMWYLCLTKVLQFVSNALIDIAYYQGRITTSSHNIIDNLEVAFTSQTPTSQTNSKLSSNALTLAFSCPNGNGSDLLRVVSTRPPWSQIIAPKPVELLLVKIAASLLTLYHSATRAFHRTSSLFPTLDSFRLAVWNSSSMYCAFCKIARPVSLCTCKLDYQACTGK